MLRVERDAVSFETENVGPNGNWMYDGRPFTGVAYSAFKDGTPRSEQQFRDGLLWGPSWERYLNGAMYAESHYFRDILHGRAREWHEDGQLAEDGEYEYRYALWSKKWTPSGDLVNDYRLSESSSAFEGLQHLRQVFAGEAADADSGAAVDG